MDADIRKTWRQRVETTEDWAITPNSTLPKVGEAQGCQMTCAGTGLTGWVKPNRVDAGRLWGPREKIASDLAYELELRVPPVLLYKRPNPNNNTELIFCSISLICYPSQYPWQRIFDIYNAASSIPDPAKEPLYGILRSTLEVGSGVVAFDAWLNNSDRDNPNNTIIGYGKHQPPGRHGDLMFIDFSNSMDWADDAQAATFRKVPVPALFASSLRLDVVKETVERIKAISNDTIEGIVSRIPVDFMKPDQKTRVLSGLIIRRDFLEPNFLQWYPGTGSGSLPP